MSVEPRPPDLPSNTRVDASNMVASSQRPAAKHLSGFISGFCTLLTQRAISQGLGHDDRFVF